SQHSNQSWLSALTTILDASALVMSGVEAAPVHQAKLTFAIARHAVVDLAQVFGTTPHDPHYDRLPPAEFARMRDNLQAHGISLRSSSECHDRLLTLRNMYEPYVHALSEYLLMPLPGWQIADRSSADNWQTSAWERVTHV